MSVDNSDIHKALIVKTGSQSLKVQLMEGSFEGQTVTVVNQLTGKMEMDEIYVQGRDILVEYSVRDGKLGRAVARGNYRLRLELVLMALFAGLLLAVGGWTGLKALLSFVFAALMLWKVMIPWFLDGKDPVLGALAVVAALTAAVSFLVGGLSKKGLVTFLGAFSGLMLTCALAKVFTGSFRIHGAVRPFAETLVYSGFGHLDLSGIFVAGIFVACSGAVMDLAMDISASMHEIAEKKPEIGFVEHVASGMAIGRSVIGTMTTTLLLAYSGSYIALLMLFMGLGVPPAHHPQQELRRRRSGQHHRGKLRPGDRGALHRADRRADLRDRQAQSLRFRFGSKAACRNSRTRLLIRPSCSNSDFDGISMPKRLQRPRRLKRPKLELPAIVESG